MDLEPGTCFICGVPNADRYLKPIRNPNPQAITNGAFGFVGPMCETHTPEEMASAVFRHHNQMAMKRPQREITLPHGAGTYRVITAVVGPEPIEEPVTDEPHPPFEEGDPLPVKLDDKIPPATDRMAAARAAKVAKREGAQV
jgi:hypothetical protein